MTMAGPTTTCVAALGAVCQSRRVTAMPFLLADATCEAVPPDAKSAASCTVIPMRIWSSTSVKEPGADVERSPETATLKTTADAPLAHACRAPESVTVALRVAKKGLRKNDCAPRIPAPQS